MFEYRRLDDPTHILPVANSAFAIRHCEKQAAREWLSTSVQQGRELYGVYENEQLLSGFMLYDYRMRLRSGVVNMGGIGLLCSRLDARGRGAVRVLLQGALATMREKGQIVSVLDPFDEGFYRKYGWEKFSRLQIIECSPGNLRIPDDDAAEFEVIDLPVPDEASRAFYNDYAAEHHTLVQRGDADWQRRTQILAWSADTAARGVVRFSQQERVVGLIGYDLIRKASEERSTFVVNLLATDRADVFREMLRYLARLSHQVSTIRLNLPMDADPWPYFADRPSSWKIQDMFMLRIVSLEGLDGLVLQAPDMCLRIRVRDPQAPWNDGTWSLDVADGVLGIRPAEQADLQCGIGGLSAVLSGFSTFRQLINAKLAVALPTYNGQDLPKSTPFLADYF